MATTSEFYSEKFSTVTENRSGPYSALSPPWYNQSGDPETDSIESSRCFKPSDRNDPVKKEFLQSLTRRVFKVGLDENVPPNQSINLEKIFTPAVGEQIKPKKSKKLFANSAFYEKGFHPTVEDQVELAKRISQSLVDQSNKSSKGQSMFVNRKKRSVKWVHEGEGKNERSEMQVSTKETKKNSLHLVMNPLGQLLDINAARRQGYNFEPALSPQICLKLVEDLNAPRGRGAELFAKRRKRSENWIVSESNDDVTASKGIASLPTSALNQPQDIKYPPDDLLETGSKGLSLEDSSWYSPVQEVSGSKPAQLTSVPAVVPKNIYLSNVKNYNTIPKTWDEAKSIYKTITDKYLTYSDF